MYENMGLKIMAGVMSALIVGVISWGISVNARLSVVEFQVQNNRQMYMDNADKADKQMKELIDKVNDIQNKITELSVKQEDGAK